MNVDVIEFKDGHKKVKLTLGFRFSEGFVRYNFDSRTDNIVVENEYKILIKGRFISRRLCLSKCVPGLDKLRVETWLFDIFPIYIHWSELGWTDKNVLIQAIS